MRESLPADPRGMRRLDIPKKMAPMHRGHFHIMVSDF
jgi:hypothetical protein